jgi:hypothetical protein
MSKWMFLLCAALVILGCATQPPAEKQVRQADEESTAAEATKQKEKTSEAAADEPAERVVTEAVYLLSREETFSPDGYTEASLEIVYEEGGTRRLEERIFGLDGEPEETKIYEYEGEKLARISTYDRYGELLTSRVHEYDDTGKLISDSLYTADKSLQVKSLYEYDRQGRKKIWIVQDGDGLEQARTEYLYGKQAGPEKIDMFSPAGDLESSVEYDFDAEGRLVRESYLDADGSTMKYIDYIYSGPGVQEERHYRGKGTLVRKIVNKFDDTGSIIEVHYFGSAGTLQAVATRVYISREVQRIITE